MQKIRPIRSYVIRQGRLTKSQAVAIESYGNQYLLDFNKSAINVKDYFSIHQPTIFEIGFGMGSATHHIAKENLKINYLVTDIHLPGIGNLIKLSSQDNLQNIKIIQHDALEILKYMIPDNSLDGMNIFFPDPWHKKRHNKRRLINQENLKLMCQKIKKRSFIHIATDWEHYANEIIDLIKKSTFLTLENLKFHERAKSRPQTKYENRGLKLGHKVWDIVAIKLEANF